MYGNVDTTQRDSILQEAVEDIAFLAGDDGLEDVLFFRIFDKKALQYVVSMKVQPTLCSVVLLFFSSILIWKSVSFDVDFVCLHVERAFKVKRLLFL